MKNIYVHISALLSKVMEMSEEDMDCVKLSICEEAEDQGQFFPAFLHLEGFAKDGTVRDYESIDSVTKRAS